MMRLPAVAALASALLLSAPSGALAQDAKTKAMEIFVKQKCSQCHSIAGKGSKKGPLDEVGQKLTPAEIKEWIVDPVGMAKKTDPPPKRKPPMKKKVLPSEEVDTLVAYLSTLKG